MNDRTIIRCKRCGEPMRIPANLNLNVTCPKCRYSFMVYGKKAPQQERTTTSARTTVKKAGQSIKSKIGRVVTSWPFLLLCLAVIVVGYLNEGHITPRNVASYLNYDRDTVVIDMHGEPTPEDMEQVTLALRDCPPKVILWDYDINFPTATPFMQSAFWVEKLSAATTTAKKTPVMILNPEYYTTDPEEIAAMQAEVDAATNEILSLCPGSSDVWSSCRIIHDELCRRASYDHSTSLPHVHDIYGALVTGQSVCEGFSRAFSYLTNKLDIPCAIVLSDTHAWNVLTDINSDQRYIDVTWDNTDEMDKTGNEQLNYTHFFITREEVESLEKHQITGIYGSPNFLFPGESQPLNYHEVMGYGLAYYSYDDVVRVFSLQDASYGKYCSVKFLNDQAWNDAQALLANRGNLLGQSFRQATGSRGSCQYWSDDALHVMNICFT